MSHQRAFRFGVFFIGRSSLKFFVLCWLNENFSGPNAVCVSLSPLNRYVMVGLASRKLHWQLTKQQVRKWSFSVRLELKCRVVFRRNQGLTKTCTFGSSLGFTFSLTHCSTVSLIYTHWKHQYLKVFWCFLEVMS